MSSESVHSCVPKHPKLEGFRMLYQNKIKNGASRSASFLVLPPWRPPTPDRRAEGCGRPCLSPRRSAAQLPGPRPRARTTATSTLSRAFARGGPSNDRVVRSCGLGRSVVRTDRARSERWAHPVCTRLGRIFGVHLLALQVVDGT